MEGDQDGNNMSLNGSPDRLGDIMQDSTTHKRWMPKQNH